MTFALLALLLQGIATMPSPSVSTDRTDGPADARTASSTLIERNHAAINGLRLYYEVHGRPDGVPLVLLHGGGSTIESTFGRVLRGFAAHRRVIALEEQGHGRTSDRDQPFSFETSADDVAALLRHLGVPQADLFGFSNGGSVALQVAIRHPELVRKLVFASSFTKRAGAPAQLWSFLAEGTFEDMPASLKAAFLEVNPDPQQLRTMHDKDAARMRAFRDVPDEQVRSIRAPTLVLIGDRDVTRPEHAIELVGLLQDARLMVLPSGHGEYLGEVSAGAIDPDFADSTVRMIERFLGAAPR